MADQRSATVPSEEATQSEGSAAAVPAPEQKAPIYTRDFNLLWASELLSFISFYILLPILPLYILSLGGSNADVGMLLSVTGLVGLVTAPLYGRALDRWSRKRFLLGGILFNIGVVLSFTVIRSVNLFAVPLTGRAIGSGASGAASRVLVFDIAPPSRRGEAISSFLLAHNAAIAFGPAIGLAVKDQFSSFTAPYFLSAVLLMVAFLVVLSVREPARGAAPHGAAPVQAGGLQAWLTPGALAPSVVQFLLASSYGSTISFLAVMAEDRGISGYQMFFTVYAVVVITMRIVTGRLSDRYGRVVVLLPALTSQMVCLLLLAAASNLPMVLGAAVLLGTGWGTAYPMLSALLADRTDPRRRGAAMGIFQAMFSLGGSVGTASVGILGELLGFQGAFLFSAGVVGLALVLSAAFFRAAPRSGQARV